MIYCPICHREIPPKDFNVSKDLAYCSACGKTFSFAHLAETVDNDASLPETLPPGLQQFEDDRGTVLSYHHRHPAAFFLLLWSLVWDGILAAIICSLLMKHTLLAWPNLFLALFAIPGILAPILMLYMFFGHQQLWFTVTGHVTSFRGLGRLGFKQEFEAADIQAIKARQLASYTKYGNTMEGYSSTSMVTVELPGNRRIRIAFASDPDRQIADYVGAALRHLQRSL